MTRASGYDLRETCKNILLSLPRLKELHHYDGQETGIFQRRMQGVFGRGVETFFDFKFTVQPVAGDKDELDFGVQMNMEKLSTQRVLLKNCHLFRWLKFTDVL